MADDSQKPVGSDRPVRSTKVDPFKPAMPQIPGVPQAPPKPPPKVEEAEEPIASLSPAQASELRAHLEAKSKKIPGAWMAAIAAGAFIFVASIAWWMLRGPRSGASPANPPSHSASDADTGAAGANPASAIAPAAQPNEVGNVQELAKPWSAKKFVFTKRYSNQSIPAMVIRLPGLNGLRGYWAFSLEPALGRCELEFVTDLNRLAREYGYRANHPMVVNPCTNSVYDPLRMGEIQAGTWARGEVVQGSDIRPPLGVELRVQGNRIIAESIE